MKPLAGQSPTAAPSSSSLTPTSSSPGDALAALLPILDAFNHRHHNQHRASHWWPVFRITRRAVRALSRDLRLSSRLGASSPHAASSSSSSQTPKSALWVDTHVLPRAYIAFIQLSADNQHAPLGILLLTVLARIHAVLTQILPPLPSDKQTTSSHLFKPTPPLQTPDAQPVNKQVAVVATPDRGVAISRHEIGSQQQQQQQQQASRKPEEDKDEREKTPVVGSKANKKKKRTKPTGKEEEEGKETKKKKKFKGDSLSNLFASLT